MATKARGYGTEYTENYSWGEKQAKASSRNKTSSGVLDGNSAQLQDSAPQMSSAQTGVTAGQHQARDHAQFQSDLYPSVYRETVAPKDQSGNYHDAFKTIANKPYGRRLMYDTTHPDKMYPSQWSSELADTPGCYSFPTTTGLPPEIPFNRDLQWQEQGEVGEWPTELWKTWRGVAVSPPYDGHDDQAEYSKYKVHVL